MLLRTIHIAIVILSFLLNSVLKAQPFNAGYNFKHLNVQNGLVYNIVYHFLQDSRGYMWIGTHNGLTLYDGTRTVNFLPDEKRPGSIGGFFITSLLEDSSHRIWIGTQTGIDLYNRATNSFTHFGIEQPDGKKENIYCVALGFVSAEELWLLETKTRSIRSLNINTGRTSFIGGINATHAQLYKGSGQTVHVWSAYDKGTIHQIYRHSKLISHQTYFDGKDEAVKTPSFEVNHIFQQNDSTAWLSTDKGLVKFNPVLNKYEIFDHWKDQPVKNIRYAALSSNNQLWGGTGVGGIFIFDLKEKRFIENHRNDRLNPFSICGDNIVSLYFDKTGNLWCGSYGSGVSYTHTGNNFFSTHVTKQDVQAWNGSNYIHWLGSDPEGNIWCTFDNKPGILILDKNLQIKKYAIPKFEDGTPFNQAMYKLVFESPSEALCTTNKGLFLYDLQTNRLRPLKYELLSDEVQGSIWMKDILRLQDGSILFSTFWGLYRMTKDNGNYIITPIQFLRPGSYLGCGALFQDETGLVYVKSLVDSFYVLKPGASTRDYRLVQESRFAPFVNQYYSEINDSLVYLATSDGLYQINKQTFRAKKNVYVSNIVFPNISGLIKKGDVIWIFGKKGLHYFDHIKNEVRTFTVEDGLPSNEFTLSRAVITPDGRCIAGSANGLVSFYYEKKVDQVYPARPQLTSIYINDTISNAFINPDETQTINLSFRENTFSFNFSPIAFQHASEYSFEYKLDGYDENWVKSGNVHYTRYSKIPPGKYVFNLKVSDAMGNSSPFVKKLEINIGKAFWQTNIFKAAIALLILLVLWWLLRSYLTSRIKQQKIEFDKQRAVEKERTRIATDMHDDLGAGLSRIKFLSQALSNKSTTEDGLRTGLEKITVYSDEMTEKMGEIVWALNEKNDTLADLVAYTRSYAIEYLSNHNISCRADTPSQLPVSFIAGEIRRNIFLSVKECLHNIVKHADATQVDFVIQLNGKIKIIIHDNGKGIDWDKQRTYSNGIHNIKKRMSEINGKAEFTNERGTRVMLRAPLGL